MRGTFGLPQCPNWLGYISETYQCAPALCLEAVPDTTPASVVPPLTSIPAANGQTSRCSMDFFGGGGLLARNAVATRKCTLYLGNKIQALLGENERDENPLFGTFWAHV